MKSLKDIDVAGKRVLVRADFNVEISQDGQVVDDFRIRATLPTLKYLTERQAKVILLAHLGRPAGQKKSEFSLTPVRDKLAELVARDIKLAPDCVGQEVKKMVAETGEGAILMLENLRWHKEEELNDEIFAKSLASLGEVYVNDAFAVSHRVHASVEAITRFLPSCAGFLLAKEIEVLTRLRDNPDHPLVVIIGGSKISTKIKLIQSFLGKAEHVILGGALANTVLYAKGIAVGKSIIEKDILPEVQKLELTDTKIHLPVDAVISTSKDGQSLCWTGSIGSTKEEEIILDIGPDSEKLFAKVVASGKMVIWNGPMGLFEIEMFAHGSYALAQAVVNSAAFSIVGGGETVAFVEKNGLVDKFSFVSTGGGAMMEFLSGEDLPGIIALNK